MTDAGGQYAFAGLAAGDYTVTIAVASDAYVFDAMSQDRTVGDDESAIVNFDGQHARNSSVSGMAFIDELNKNNEQDAGENALPQAGIPVALVGPGFNDQRLSVTGPDGSFSFSDLRAGDYRLLVPIDETVTAALMAADVAYGGPQTGFEITLGVDDNEVQGIPFDITHTTVNFTVSLRSGDEMGDALPGATVSLYGANNAMVNSGMTGDDGSVAIKVARDRTVGNMVNAGVSADDYDVAEGMTAVSWDPQMFATSGANANDIVNLNVNVNISGRTVETGHPDSGQPLGGWAIGVTMGDAAVEGAPTELDSMGMASLETTVSEVPATFTFAVADDQDDELDGGEAYEGSGGTYVHDGLSLAGAVDADDPMVVTYMTQTLMVFVHEEVDQAHGYTGNVGHGDQRKSGIATLRVVRPSTGSLTRSLSGWDGEANTKDDKKGGYTFKNLPADQDIAVLADARDGYKLLAPHRLDTYRNFEDNGVTGSAFGDHGGWGHTVMLCPLQAVDPTGQNFDECGTFAAVATHDVSVTVSKMRVRKSSSGTGFNSADPSSTHQPGIEVSLTPVEGKNLAGEGESFAVTDKNKGAHDFGAMAAGTYEVGVPEGWRGMSGAESAASAFSPLDGDVELAVTPATATVYGVVRAEAPQDPTEPGLANVTVVVNDEDDLTTQTDDYGRYIISGIKAGKAVVKAKRAGYPDAKETFTSLAANTVTSHDFVLSGSNNTITITGRVTEQGTDDGIKGVVITVDGKAPLNAATSGDNMGKVVTGDDGEYIAIVNTTDPTTQPTVAVKPTAEGWTFIPASLPVSGITGDDDVNFQGWRTTRITGMVRGVKPFGAKARPPMSDVMVKAEWLGVAPGDKTVTTGSDGIFTFDVPTLAGSVTITAMPTPEDKLDVYRADYELVRDAARYVWFDPPSNRAGGNIVFIPGQRIVNFGIFDAQSVQPQITKVERVKLTAAVEPATGKTITPTTRSWELIKDEPTDQINVTWVYQTRNAYPATADITATSTHAENAYSAANVVDDDGTGGTDGAVPLTTQAVDENAFTAPAGADGVIETPAATTTATTGTTVSHTRTTTYTLSDAGDAEDYGAVQVKIGHTVVDGSGAQRDSTEAISLPVALAAVDNTVTELVARRLPANANADRHHLIAASWRVDGSPRLEQRVALLVPGQGPGNNTEAWLIVPNLDRDGTGPSLEGMFNRITEFGGDFARWQWGGLGAVADAATTSDDLDLEEITLTGWTDLNLGIVITANLDREDLLAASRLLVQTRVHGDDDWKSFVVDIPNR